MVQFIIVDWTLSSSSEAPAQIVVVESSVLASSFHASSSSSSPPPSCSSSSSSSSSDVVACCCRRRLSPVTSVAARTASVPSVANTSEYRSVPLRPSHFHPMHGLLHLSELLVSGKVSTGTGHNCWSEGQRASFLRRPNTGHAVTVSFTGFHISSTGCYLLELGYDIRVDVMAMFSRPIVHNCIGTH